MNIRKMIEVIKAFRSNAPFGDVAAMKIDALRSTPPEIKKRLQHLSGKTLDIEISNLVVLPNGTLGKVYEEHLRENNLTHLSVSPEMTEKLRDNPYAILFTQTHDLHHVLTGFDTSIAGEVGVAAFNVGQGIGPVPKITWNFIKYFYFLTAPSQFSAIKNNLKLGEEMGRKARLLIAEPLQDLLNLPLEEARSRVGIENSDVKKTKRGGASWLANLIYGSAER